MVEVIWRGGIKLALLALLVLAPGASAGAKADDYRGPDLGDYELLEVPDGHKLSFRAYAEGVQIYQWNGTSWVFVAPEAVLYDQDGEVVGIHYAGPIWESASGSKVKGAVIERATVDADAIPWLLLGAVATEGPGIFNGVTYIQRVNTVGGLAPAYAGEFVGEVVRVPYAADYYFYRKHQ
ncbi:MAG: DUF3455 domain-containing protein [Planctomycetia bacterium]|nr:DUF3455 domain-containing protein [Planctomycetia bacterium]